MSLNVWCLYNPTNHPDPPYMDLLFSTTSPDFLLSCHFKCNDHQRFSPINKRYFHSSHILYIRTGWSAYMFISCKKKKKLHYLNRQFDLRCQSTHCDAPGFLNSRFRKWQHVGWWLGYFCPAVNELFLHLSKSEYIFNKPLLFLPYRITFPFTLLIQHNTFCGSSPVDSRLNKFSSFA